MAKLSTKEKKFRAEADAFTLSEAETIKLDKGRFGLALKSAVEMAVRQRKAADVLARVSKMKPKKGGE